MYVAQNLANLRLNLVSNTCNARLMEHGEGGGFRRCVAVGIKHTKEERRKKEECMVHICSKQGEGRGRERGEGEGPEWVPNKQVGHALKIACKFSTAMYPF